MILKEFQKRVVASVRDYLKGLHDWRERAVAIMAHDPDYDWVAKAWPADAPGQYLPRRNGLDAQLPAFCIKVPTGGGKTLLAIKIIDLVNVHYRRRQTGLVLWIVPSTQIYNQTLRALKDRDHPYRQQLDVFSAGRTSILEKTSAFSPADVRENLCVLLLMLPSANRETKESLRMFRDSGGFERFFPREDDAEGQRKLLGEVPNLDTFESGQGLWRRQVKTSLGNTLRLLRPLIIVLDEGHKAYSRNAKKTLEGFNPCMVVELSATPPKGANVLVEVSGRELLAEEMIKLDLHIRNSGSVDWKHTMLSAIEQRERLERIAQEHETETRNYIRPICLIQVERTGREQRGAGFIHAEDAREYLLRYPGIRPEHIAVKTSQKDDLKEVDEAGGLLSPDCPIRYIITKHALQEGWDCAFAYVLAVLSNPTSRSALTQLVGRILRQPSASKTRVPALDESYVYCFQRQGADLLNEVRRGFGLEGLQGLEDRVALDADEQASPGLLTHRHRPEFETAARNLVLPAFMIQDEGEWRLVSYESDILSRIPWGEVDVTPLYELPLQAEPGGELEIRAGLEDNLELASVQENVAGEGALDYYFAASHLLDAMPNPWRGHEAARRVFGELLERHPREQVVANYVFVLEEMRKRLESERDRLAQRVFGEMLDVGVMRFMVVTDDLAAFNRPPPVIESSERAKQANRDDGRQFDRSLFDFNSEDDVNGLERSVATYLDRQERLFFWYRNRARKDYYVQGWKRGRIYADFVFTLRADEPDTHDPFHQVFVMETKGVHLKRTEDTDYKRSVFAICSEHARKADWAEFVPAMQDKVVRFEVVDEDEWEQRLNGMLAS